MEEYGEDEAWADNVNPNIAVPMIPALILMATSTQGGLTDSCPTETYCFPRGLARGQNPARKAIPAYGRRGKTAELDWPNPRENGKLKEVDFAPGA